MTAYSTSFGCGCSVQRHQNGEISSVLPCRMHGVIVQPELVKLEAAILRVRKADRRRMVELERLRRQRPLDTERLVTETDPSPPDPLPLTERRR